MFIHLIEFLAAFGQLSFTFNFSRFLAELLPVEQFHDPRGGQSVAVSSVTPVATRPRCLKLVKFSRLGGARRLSLE